MRVLIPLLVIIPALEIGVLLLSGKTIGVWPTVLLIILTGVVGAYLAKRQGMAVIRNARLNFSNGKMPGEALMDGICILIGGILLLTPGFITDLTGFLLLLPFTRTYIKPFMVKKIRKWFDNGNIIIMK
ncbi:UPF0716 protein FxsA [Oikeobacillus pervagus]|uniref:UPF0716 protein FxsA n=1 Tax=Oikeobacillus pervagus TaxID=1325931 RepID=A0AAJ1WIT2_9BACI|nr:FxsA family protein [Oikeobacillus pervagus]MDQ0214980.1 UPF0716 protein FxsA [Oikeobacillus pervagus]